MKKRGIIFTMLSMSLSLFMFGCSSSSDLDEESITNLGKKYSEEMANGAFSNISANFTDNLKEKITEDQLKQSWDTVVKDIGKYEQINDVNYRAERDSAVVEVVLKYELNGLKVTTLFTADEKVGSININYAPIKEEITTSEEFEEKEIKIGKEENKLDGILTMPKDTENPPVVILVQGSGQSDMNETTGAVGNKPFKDLAHGLAKEGVASIRYNKRYFQYPETASKDITIEDEVINDVNLAIDLAYETEGLDKENIIVVGHSLGGMVAPKIASDNEKVSGMVSLAGSPRNFEDIIYDQNRDAVNAMTDKTQEEKDALLAQVKAEVDKVKNLKEGDKGQTILGISSEYWLSLNELNTKEVVKNLEIPMLFLQGSDDFQVYADVDYTMWQELCNVKSNASFVLYEGLNHLFMTSNGKADATEYDVKGNVSDEVVKDLASWINENK